VAKISFRTRSNLAVRAKFNLNINPIVETTSLHVVANHRGIIIANTKMTKIVNHQSRTTSLIRSLSKRNN